jgi:hypothetical protein
MVSTVVYKTIEENSANTLTTLVKIRQFQKTVEPLCVQKLLKTMWSILVMSSFRWSSYLSTVYGVLPFRTRVVSKYWM